MSLDSVKNYIQKKSHLPNIPAAKILEGSGLELGEMQRLQMIKIEELTLYLIQQSELIKKLQVELNALKEIKQ